MRIAGLGLSVRANPLWYGSCEDQRGLVRNFPRTKSENNSPPYFPFSFMQTIVIQFEGPILRTCTRLLRPELGKDWG